MTFLFEFYTALKFRWNRMNKMQRLKSLFCNLSQVDLNRFEINSDHEEEEKSTKKRLKETNPQSNSTSDHWIDIKGSCSKLSNWKIQSKISEDVLGLDWELINWENVKHQLEDLDIDWNHDYSQNFNENFIKGDNNLLEDPMNSLLKRTKNQRLSFSEKSLIYKEIKINKQKPFDVASKYWITTTTIYNIIESFAKIQSNLFSKSRRNSRIILNSEKICQVVSKYWNNNIHPYTCKDVCKYILRKLGVRLTERIVAKILKEILQMTYKKGKSRPIEFQQDRQDLLKWYFAAKIIPLLSQFDMLINIDETSFSRWTKLEYSWSRKGETRELLNIGYTYSTSLIVSTTSSWKVLAANTKGPVNASMFIQYLLNLDKFVEEVWSTNMSKWLIILDSATTHKSKKTTEFWKKQNWTLAFILPYMPELAPIEKYFSKLKKLVLRRRTETKISWQSIKADCILWEWIMHIDEESVRKLLSTFTQELNKGLSIWDSIL